MSTIVGGKLWMLLAGLTEVGAAALVVEDRYSQIFKLSSSDSLPWRRPGLSPASDPSTSEVRAWAITTGLAVSDRGRLRPEIWAAYNRSHQH